VGLTGWHLFLSVLNEQLGLNHAKAGTGGADKESVESCGANGQQFGNLFLKGCNVVILERQMPSKQHKQDYPTRPKSLCSRTSSILDFLWKHNQA